MPNQPSNDILHPQSLVLPPVAQGGNPTITGQIVVSGATLLWYDGSAVREISGDNTGD